MNIQRVAIIFDNTLRRETTGVYCRRALGQLVDVEHFLPGELDRIPRGRFDLFLNVDDGLDYAWPDDLRPAAYWAIDTHIDFDRSLQKAKSFEHVFAAQKDGARRLYDAGMTTTGWLPLACDPDLHGKQSVDKQYDVAFVGNIFPGPREELLEQIQREFPQSFVGRRYFQEMASIYSSARVVFNRSVANDVNMRVFEGLCSGSLLLTNDLSDNGQADLFRDGLNHASYEGAEDLLDKIRWYLDHESERERIAAAGREEVLAHHTYQHRMQAVLEMVSSPARQQAASQSKDLARPKKGQAYFEFARPEVLALVPRTAERVLDIGCGAGRLGLSIKERQGAHVVGVELDPKAAAIAQMRLDDVLIGNVEDGTVDFPGGSFDCVICADVLEHMRRPRPVLEKIARWLTPGGQLIASIPNARHHSVIQSLLDGNFTYEPAGLLDEDHVRFFTRREIEKLFFRAGFTVDGIQIVPGPGHREWNERGRPGVVEAGPLRIGGLSVGDAEEFYTYQFLVTAQPLARPDYCLTSIVIVTHNQLSYTHQCVESIRFVTDEPYELIVVDNRSTDGTVEFLRDQDDVALIENTDNLGFPAAANQGIRAARGGHILLLNNDTLVTTAWLRRLLAALHADDSVGVVGPCTNNISGAQQVPVSYTDLSGLDGFAWEWGKRNARRTLDTDRLVGFCLLFKREVVEAIGLLDEQFGIGNFEDDDYCRRALQAGYRCVIAQDAFIHHFGGTTFRATGVDFASLMAENQRKYEQKWRSRGLFDKGSVKASSQTTNHRSDFIVRVAPGGGLLLERKPNINQPATEPSSTSPIRSALRAPSSELRLSLCMIVRDNEHTIRPCLESIKPWVDEMIVVDTGSKDATPRIAAELGARVYEFPWCDDFAAARNESLKYARGEWIFWMDSDDTIPEQCGRKLRELADREQTDNILGHVMQVHCPGSGDEGRHDVTIVDHVKLFRNRSDLRFEFCIHEQILPAIRRAGGEVAFTEIYVVHSGSDHTEKGRAGKYDRDFRILAKDLAERPDHPFVLFNLGMTYADAQRYDEAISYLNRCIDVSNSGESHLRKAYALLVSSLSQAERHVEAWDICQRGRALFPEDAELLFRTGLLHHHFGRLDDAERAYREALENPRDRYFTSIDAGIGGYKARHNLAIVYEEMGDWQKAEAQWRTIIDDQPDYRQACRALADLLLKHERFDDLEEFANQKLCDPSTSDRGQRCEGWLMLARVAEARGAIDEAGRLYEEGISRFSGDPEPLRQLCRFHFERGGPARAKPALLKLARRQRQDASVLHNLGTGHLFCHHPHKAVTAYRQSLRFRGNSAETYLHLGYALRDCGKNGEAVSAWEKVLEIEPLNSAARQALQSD